MLPNPGDTLAFPLHHPLKCSCILSSWSMNGLSKGAIMNRKLFVQMVKHWQRMIRLMEILPQTLIPTQSPQNAPLDDENIPAVYPLADTPPLVEISSEVQTTGNESMSGYQT